MINKGGVKGVETPLPPLFNIESNLMMPAALRLVHGDLSTALSCLKKSHHLRVAAKLPHCQTGLPQLPAMPITAIVWGNILKNTREHSTGRIITVIGVTEDRLAGAGVIGEFCVSLSDQRYFTCDNPPGVIRALFARLWLKKLTQPVE